MSRLKTKQLLMMLAGIGILGMLLISFLAAFLMDSQLNRGVGSLSNEGRTLRILLEVETANLEFKRQVQEWKDTLLRGNDPEKFDKYFGNFKKREASVDDALGRAKEKLNAAGMSSEAGEIDDIVRKHDELGRKYREALASYDKSNPESGHVVDKLVAGIDRPMTQAISDFSKRIEAESAQRKDKETALLDRKYHEAMAYFSVLLLVMIGSVSGFSVLCARIILSQLGGEPMEGASAARAIASGDLSVRINSSGNEKSLMASMEAMRNQLRQIIGNMKSVAAGLNHGSNNLAASSTSVQQGSRRQSESASESASAIEEMVASVDHMHENAMEVQALTERFASHSESSRKIMSKLGADMQSIFGSVSSAETTLSELGDQSQKIQEVVDVIKEIADQTNLLALNAAIEAARAGEQGRGFAVVADEVRKLAERTASSTIEIAGIIEKIQESVAASISGMEVASSLTREGTDLARNAIRSVDEIGTGSASVLTGVSGITHALQEQRVGSLQIAKNVELIARMSAENESAVATSTGIAKDLEKLAQTLEKEISRFTV